MCWVSQLGVGKIGKKPQDISNNIHFFKFQDIKVIKATLYYEIELKKISHRTFVLDKVELNLADEF